MYDVFLKPRSQGPAVGWLWIGSFKPEDFRDARGFARRNRERGRVRFRKRKRQAN